MELKNYQKKVMDNLTSYMNCLNRCNNVISGWREYWFRQDINVGFDGVPGYNNVIKGVPHVCMKVPTGGGKTFMGCASIKKMFDAMPQNKMKVVVWLVPTDSILTQTIKTLSDVNHPYRQRLDSDFSGRVGIYTKDQLLNGQNFSPDTVREMLTVCIMSYSSLRINSKLKDVRKVYQENGNLLKFADFFEDKDVLLADTPDTALIQVIRQLSPVVIVDESHNATSDLSVEMLNNLNPAFILDLTATPRKESNIISYVDARELKKENMVKLPVIVYNRDKRQSVIQDAIQLRGQIEAQAKREEANGGAYIRPIVLFQAQPNLKDKENETFDKIKETLVGIGIPEEQIGIKTSEVDTISKYNLLSRDCPIRYIITVNALKEGWDCPFAYILASLANKSSVVDVEQIVGRILRQPYARQHTSPLLNTSYVLTCSNDFRITLESIVSGLNKAGFSRKDYRLGQFEEEISSEPVTEQVQIEITDVSTETVEDTFDDINVDEVKTEIFEVRAEEIPNETVADMIQQATAQAEEYSEEVNSSMENGFIGGELGNMLQQNGIQIQYRESAAKLKIPQFFIKSIPDMFGDEYELLEPENLSEGFSLVGQDATINFDLATGEMYRVDLQEEGEAVPKYRKTSKDEAEFIRNYLAQFPEERRKEICINNIIDIIGKSNRFAAAEIRDYVKRCIANMTEDQMNALETSYQIYAKKIMDKIESLEDVYRERKFYQWLDSGKIVCRDSYVLPEVITPADTTDSIPLSLYDSEKNDMNNFEHKVIDAIAGLNNIEFWHRIIDRKGFRLNGFINHYPDFLVKTKSGNVVFVEAKGDYLDGDDSKTKLKLGREWQSHCTGHLYRYFMVFNNKDLGETGAYSIDDFIEVMKEL